MSKHFHLGAVLISALSTIQIFSAFKTPQHQPTRPQDPVTEVKVLSTDTAFLSSCGLNPAARPWLGCRLPVTNLFSREEHRAARQITSPNQVRPGISPDQTYFPPMQRQGSNSPLEGDYPSPVTIAADGSFAARASVTSTIEKRPSTPIAVTAAILAYRDPIVTEENAELAQLTQNLREAVHATQRSELTKDLTNRHTEFSASLLDTTYNDFRDLHGRYFQQKTGLATQVQKMVNQRLEDVHALRQLHPGHRLDQTQICSVTGQMFDITTGHTVHPAPTRTHVEFLSQEEWAALQAQKAATKSRR